MPVFCDRRCNPAISGYSWNVTTPGLIVVGSGPAGISAAMEFRRRNVDLPVLIVTDDPDLPYARPPLSKEYLRGDTDDVTLHDAAWFSNKGIELLHASPVDAIDPAAHCIAIGDTVLPYRSLVLACGSAPTPLALPGGDIPLQLRSLSDASRLRDASSQADAAVVIGAGFIGCEAAASLAMRGVATTLVAPDQAPQTKRLGVDAGNRLRWLLEEVGVHYVGGVAVSSVERRHVVLADGDTIDTDLIVAATGVRPRSELATGAGLMTKDGRIVVGADMRTSAEDVYAAGDVALAYNAGAGRYIAVEHWQDAVDQGAIAGAGAAEEWAEWDDVPGFWSTIGDATLKYHAWGDGYDRTGAIALDLRRDPDRWSRRSPERRVDSRCGPRRERRPRQAAVDHLQLRWCRRCRSPPLAPGAEGFARSRCRLDRSVGIEGARVGGRTRPAGFGRRGVERFEHRATRSPDARSLRATVAHATRPRRPQRRVHRFAGARRRIRQCAAT